MIKNFNEEEKNVGEFLDRESTHNNIRAEGPFTRDGKTCLEKKKL